MTLKPVASYGLTGEASIELSQNNLHSFVAQVEAELYRSDTYRHAIASLQTILGEAARTAQVLIQAVSREAIQLAMGQLSAQSQMVVSTPVPGQESAIASSNLEDPAQSFGSGAMAYAPATIPENPYSSRGYGESAKSLGDREPSSPSPFSDPSGQPSPTKKPKKFQKTANPAAPNREQVRLDCLRQIGQQLCQARQARSLSLEHIHSQTLIPLDLIEALEKGYVERLPEDVYVRGFLHRIGDALGLDGVAIAASLPTPDPVKSVVPSWYQSAAPKIELRPVHLYLGYAALVAGAAGGLALLSQQSSPATDFDSELHLPSPSEDSQSSRKFVSPTQKPGLTNNNGSVTVGLDIAPPEQFMAQDAWA